MPGSTGAPVLSRVLRPEGLNSSVVDGDAVAASVGVSALGPDLDIGVNVRVGVSESCIASVEKLSSTDSDGSWVFDVSDIEM